MISLNNISVTFNKGTPLQNRVFHQLNLKINSGEFVTVIGGNGAGKSALMNLLSGETPVDEGSIILDNTNVTNWVVYERSQLISRVFQDPLLGSYAELTIEENLSLAYNRGKRRSLKIALNNNLRELFKERLRDIGIGLENRFTDKIGLLSGGQRQAVSLIMATLQPSKILLLELTQKLINEKQLTALMITHCMSQALEFGTRTLVIHQGKIVRDLNNQERQSLQASDLMGFF